MPRPDPERLAAALRENLKRRKARARAPEPSLGTDEEGDVAPPQHGDAPPGAWVGEGKSES